MIINLNLNGNYPNKWGIYTMLEKNIEFASYPDWVTIDKNELTLIMTILSL